MRRVRKQRSSVQHQAARVSSEVAEVANRPKKRPGRRERSSITTRWRIMLAESRTIPKSYSTASKKREGLLLPSFRGRRRATKKRGYVPRFSSNRCVSRLLAHRRGAILLFDDAGRLA